MYAWLFVASPDTWLILAATVFQRSRWFQRSISGNHLSSVKRNKNFQLYIILVIFLCVCSQPFVSIHLSLSNDHDQKRMRFSLNSYTKQQAISLCNWGSPLLKYIYEFFLFFWGRVRYVRNLRLKDRPLCLVKSIPDLKAQMLQISIWALAEYQITPWNQWNRQR